jgi:hypothetical protein
VLELDAVRYFDNHSALTDFPSNFVERRKSADDCFQCAGCWLDTAALPFSSIILTISAQINFGRFSAYILRKATCAQLTIHSVRRPHVEVNVDI